MSGPDLAATPDPSTTHVPVPAGNPSAAFSALDRAVPLLLLPVRLETRFRGAALRVRIYPDQIHLDDHDPQLTADEQQIGHAYWKAWTAAADDTARAASREWLVSRLPARRAAWVARATRPTIGERGQLVFPRLALGAGDRQPTPAALPARWAVIGYVRDAAGELVHRFTAFTAPVAEDLALGLDPAGDAAWSTKSGALPVDPRVAWMVDYDTAVAKGMAVTVAPAQLGTLPADGLALVLAVGVSSRTPADGAREFAALLEAHTYSDGLAFAPQGTPTNNTDEVESVWSFREPDPAALLARELDGADAATAPTSSGVRLAAALGLNAHTVLGRLEHASGDEETPAAAMNRALWPVTWGQYFEQLLANADGVSAVPRAAIESVRARFLAHVRGGATLPAIRAGAQPYGILPVRFVGDPVEPATATAWTEDILMFLRDAWVESLPSVARMDPVLGASGGSAANDPESHLVEILASLPHPRRFALRWLRDWREDSYDTDWALVLALFGLVFLAGKDPTYGYDALSVLGRWGWARHVLGSAEYLGIPNSEVAKLDAIGLADADAQLAALRGLRGRLASLHVDVAQSEAWIDYMIGQVEKHRDRQPPLDELAETSPLEFSGVLADAVDDPTIAYGLYDSDDKTRLWYRALVEREGAGPGATAHDYLAALARRVPGLVVGHAPAARAVVAGDPFGGDAPLLYQLLDTVVDDVSALDGAAYRDALATLGALPADELELRFRETLGLATHRLDAWFTSLARERLDAMRKSRPSGLQLGGFGWVTDLVPDATGTAASQGFIHAPSLPQAATAAILRAGWSAHGTTRATSSLAVDLRGARIADAGWLLDGIRQGQALGELLGTRFERRLHDRGLDAWIDPVRRAVLIAGGDTGAPRAPIDGLALHELDAAGGLDSVLAGAGADAVGLRAALADVGGALNAVGDAGIAESVHQVAQGNLTRAAATLDAISLGEVPPPELDHARTPARGPAVTHRIVALLGGAGSWASTPRSTLEPALEAWAAALLGAPDRAVASVTIGTAAPKSISMADLGVSALDAISEAPAGELDDGSPWMSRLRAWALDRDPTATTVTIDPTAAQADEVSFAELAQHARALAALFGRARALDARDLAAPETTVEPGRDAADAEARAASLAAGFRAAADALVAVLPAPTDVDARPVGDRPLGDVRVAMRALAGYAVPGAVPTVGWREDERAALYAQAWSLATAAAERTAALDAAALAIAEASTTADEQTRVDRAVATAALIAGRAAPLLPRAIVNDRAAITAAFAGTRELLDGDLAAPAAWLQQVARVRPDAAVLDDVAALADLLGGAAPRYAIAQLPPRAGERWLARTAPIDRAGPRLDLVAADAGGVASLASGAPVTGLVVDEWVERVPSASRSTGLAFHFDAPAARAPQSLLLVVPPAGEAWDLDLIAATLCATLDAARLRAIGPETLSAYGHHLPAIYPPAALDPGTVEDA